MTRRDFGNVTATLSLGLLGRSQIGERYRKIGALIAPLLPFILDFNRIDNRVIVDWLKVQLNLVEGVGIDMPESLYQS